MPSPIADLRAQIDHLERALETELGHARDRWRYRIEASRVRFERDVHLAHLRLKQSIPAFIRESDPINVLTAPVIYSLIVPIMLIDLWIAIYQAICFRMYGIARVHRSAYVVIDRQHLAYLNAIEKINCMYCGYANGVLAYVREVAARTEQYWCPIRHARAGSRRSRALSGVRRVRRRRRIQAATAGLARGTQARPGRLTAHRLSRRSTRNSSPAARWAASASKSWHWTSSHSWLRPMIAFADTAT